jgi:hypothetical protein
MTTDESAATGDIDPIVVVTHRHTADDSGLPTTGVAAGR